MKKNWKALQIKFTGSQKQTVSPPSANETGRGNKMPDIESGLKTAIFGPVIGFLISAVVSTSFGSGNGLAVMFNLLSVIVGIESLQKAKYWGIMYSLGYLAGIALIGKYLMESWEYPIYLLVIGVYLFLKITKKIG